MPVTSATRKARFAYSRSLFRPPQERPIDRGKEAKANTEKLTNHTGTHEEIALKNNKDWREDLKQIAVEKAYKRDLEEEHGITFDPVVVAPVVPPVPEAPPTQEDIEDDK